MDASNNNRTHIYSDDLSQVPNASNFSVVVAIDLGTSGTGYAFAFGEKDEIHPNRAWENTKLSDKTLTFVVMKKSDQTLASFGNKGRYDYANFPPEEQHDYLVFERFKMNLFEKDGKMRSTAIKANNAEDTVDLTKLITVTLQYVKQRVMDELNRSVPKPLTPDRVLWVLTVPAIWDNAAKQIMKRAAVVAGLCSEDESNFLIALEPEAAALYCCKNTELQLKPNDKFLVVDAGGGTVDITCHRVEGNTLEAMIPPQGGNWGSTYVNENYENFLRDLLGSDLIDRAKQKPEWIDVIEKFEEMKLGASLTLKSIGFNIGPLVAEANGGKTEIQKKIETYNKTKSETELLRLNGIQLIVPMPTFRKFFAEVITNTKNHLANLLAKPELKGIDYVFLVGGFAESELLQQAIKDLLSGNEKPKLIIPTRPRLAVLIGAVHFGYQPSAVASRVTPYSIGVEKLDEWQPSIHKASKKVSVGGKEYCKDVFHPFVSAGQILRSNFKVDHVFIPVQKGQKEAEIPIVLSKSANVMFTDEPRVVWAGNLQLTLPPCDVETDARQIKVTMTFGGTVYQVAACDVNTGAQVQAKFEWDLTPKPKPATVFQAASLDLCFAMDCTGSMSSWINEAKNKIVTIGNTITSSFKDMTVRVAFVGYRDLNDDRRFEIHTFTNDFKNVQTLLATVTATGGDDTPEDIYGALSRVLKLHWTGGTRVFIHVADAPCHGKNYHNVDDSHPDQPAPDDLVRTLARNGIHYYFVKISTCTDKMTSIFANLMRQENGKFELKDLSTETSLFMPTVLEFVTKSVASYRV